MDLHKGAVPEQFGQSSWRQSHAERFQVRLLGTPDLHVYGSVVWNRWPGGMVQTNSCRIRDRKYGSCSAGIRRIESTDYANKDGSVLQDKQLERRSLCSSGRAA